MNTLTPSSDELERQASGGASSTGTAPSSDSTQGVRQDTRAKVNAVMADDIRETWDFTSYSENAFSINPNVNPTHSVAYQIDLLRQMASGLESLTNLLMSLRQNFRNDLERNACLTTTEAASIVGGIYVSIEGASSGLARKIVTIDVPVAVELYSKLIKNIK